MKVTIKKGTETRGLLTKTSVHKLSIWVAMNEDEKAAVNSSGIPMYQLLEVHDPVEDKYERSYLSNFLTYSGPVNFSFKDAFSMNAAAQTFKEEITKVSESLKAYMRGDITREESFEV